MTPPPGGVRTMLRLEGLAMLAAALLGFGLHHGDGFGVTHLGRIGRADPW